MNATELREYRRHVQALEEIQYFGERVMPLMKQAGLRQERSTLWRNSNNALFQQPTN